MTKALGYLRVSSSEQVESGAGLAAQKAAIEAEVAHRGWEFGGFFEDSGISGKALTRRPGLEAALELLRQRRADVLVVAKLDRLTRSVGDLVDLLARSAREKWALTLLDLGVDTTTAAGEMMAHIVGSFAQHERRLISQRTKDALAAKRAQGVRLGAPTIISPEVEAQIVRRRSEGATLRQIADELSAEGIPTARGGDRWSHPTVGRVLERHVVPKFSRGRRRNSAGNPKVSAAKSSASQSL